MRSKLAFGLLAVMVALALAPSSFAQINITIFNTPSPMEIKTNRTAETSDPSSKDAGIVVSGALVASSNVSTTNLVLTFPSTITSGVANPGTGVATDVPTGDAIRITAATGVFAAASIVTASGSTITISLIGAADITGNTQSGSFKLIGTRVDANGLTAPASATASLSSSGNNIFLATSTVPLITALGDGIASVTQDVVSGTNPGPLTIFTNKTVVNASSSLLVTEGFNFAWRTAAENQIDSPGAAGVGATQIRLTLNGIPSTTTVTVNTPSASSGLSVTGPFPAALTSTSNTVVITVTADKPGSIDKFAVPMTINAPTSTPTVGAITATATMYPLGNALNTNGTIVSTPNPVVPRFLANEVGPATVGNIVSASTTMLIPYALKLGGYDTGIAIANTTADPFGATAGGATPTAGTITLDFFPRTATGAGTPFTLTTSATVRPGLGLATDGTLPAGGTWSALLAEILTAAGQSGDFAGYIFIRTNFLLAHGAATISDFKTYSLATPVLVLSPPALGSRNTPGSSVESLNQ